MKDNPPAAADARAMKRFAAIGIAPGQAVRPAKLDPAVAEGVEQGRQGRPSQNRRRGQEAAWKSGQRLGDASTDIGRYGTDYLFRAVVALVGLGANLPEDAVYPHATVDADGKAPDGANRYVFASPRASSHRSAHSGR